MSAANRLRTLGLFLLGTWLIGGFLLYTGRIAAGLYQTHPTAFQRLLEMWKG